MIALLNIANLAANDGSFAAYVLKLYDSKYTSSNKVNLDFGLSELTPTFDEVPNIDLPITTAISLKYGFSRITKKLFYKNFSYHSFEYAFIENRNSHLIRSTTDNRLNIWRFGFGWANGYSKKILSKDIELVHDININWMKTRYPNFSNNDNLSKFIDKWRFGSDFEFGINIPVHKDIRVELRKINSLSFYNFKMLPWFLGFGLDNLLQRWPDLIEEELVSSLNESFPIILWAYRTFVSYSIYKLRENNSFWPSKGIQSLSSSGFAINLRFSF
ncbi:hypothetical protein OAQ99_04575 [Candidatus Kapabacteria bacterium]|nr:hypothetical protein [Candidatus Kapabacteria bacterium]